MELYICQLFIDLNHIIPPFLQGSHGGPSTLLSQQLCEVVWVKEESMHVCVTGPW